MDSWNGFFAMFGLPVPGPAAVDALTAAAVQPSAATQAIWKVLKAGETVYYAGEVLRHSKIPVAGFWNSDCVALGAKKNITNEL